MAQIILTIPDAVLPRVITGVCNSQNYATNALPGETQGQFAKRMLVLQVKGWVKSAEISTVQVNAQAQKANIEQDIDTNISIS